MEEDNQTLLSSNHTRHRSPIFTKEETKALVDLIEKYKCIVLNKSNNNASCHAKEIAWNKITQSLNSQGFKHNRSADSLKVKWDNLKKEARKLSKNLINIDNDDFDDVTSQIVSMINESDNDNTVYKDIVEELKVTEMEESLDTKVHDTKYWNEVKEQSSKEQETPDRRRFGVNRSANFSPQECSVLLKCVRPEKKYIFSLDYSNEAILLKNHAWSRITQSFNKICSQKRSTKMLRTKFTNMKRQAKLEARSFFDQSKTNKYNQIKNDENEFTVKLESSFDINEDDEQEIVDHTVNEDVSDDLNDLCDPGIDVNVVLAPDPLSTVLNSDSGLGSMNDESCNGFENKEVVKLKMELLQYQMATAKLERKRIEDNIKAQAEANNRKATEMALRLRAARLEAVAAAMKLASAHAALQYTPEEALAQQYLSQYHET